MTEGGWGRREGRRGRLLGSVEKLENTLGISGRQVLIQGLLMQGFNRGVNSPPYPEAGGILFPPGAWEQHEISASVSGST